MHLQHGKKVPCLPQEERAVLKLTEEITEIAKKGVTDETYQQVKEYYTDKEIAQIIIAINHMNFLIGLALLQNLECNQRIRKL